MSSRIVRGAFPMGMAALLALSGSGLAQTGFTGAGQGPSERWRVQGQEIRGKILNTRMMRAQDTTAEILAALIETDEGRQLVVDLGPVHQFREQQHQVRRGDEIIVRGQFTQFGNQQVLLAQELRADGQTLTLSRRGQPLQQRWQRGMDVLEDYEAFLSQGTRYGQAPGRGTWDDRFLGREFLGAREDYYGERLGRPGLEPRPQQIRGQLIRTRQVELPGLEESWQFALLRTDQGRQTLVYLGPTTQLEGLSLTRGEEIEVRGPTLVVHGEPIVLAQHIRIRGDLVPIAQRTRAEMLSSSQQLRGEILRTRWVELPGLPTPLLFAHVRPERGRAFLVCLGPSSELQGLALNRGQEIDVRGWAFQVGEDRIILAQHLRAEGQTIHLGEPTYGPRTRFQESRLPRLDEPRTIEMSVRDFEFDPPRLTVRPQEEVNVMLLNRGEAAHGVVFEIPGMQVGMQRPLRPGEARTVAFTAPERPGRYVFYCPVGDHRQRGMQGELIVMQQ